MNIISTKMNIISTSKFIFNRNNLMLKQEGSKQNIFQTQEFQFQNFQQEFQDSSERVKINFSNHVILNKSAIQVFNCENNPQMLIALKSKIDCTLIQKLNLSKCNIRNFSQFLPQVQNDSADILKVFVSQQRSNIRKPEMRFKNLKQLILENNYIQKIPQNIFKLESLLILKLNRNQVGFVPFLGNISHFQIKQNPIKQLSVALQNSRLTVFQMDWVDFIVQRNAISGFGTNSSENTQYFMQLLNKIQKKINQDVITFADIFQAKIKNKSLQYIKRIISIYFNKALNTNFTLFFQYLKNVSNINLNELKFNGKLILQKVLQENYQYLIPLFMQKKSNLNSNDLYFENICLACRYSNIRLFRYLMTMKTKKLILAQHQQFIRMQVLYSFNKDLNSHQILTQIIQNSTKKYPQTFIIPNDFTKKQSQCIGQALIYIISNDKIFAKFDLLNEINYQNDQLYLQFSVYIKNMLLLKLLLFKVKVNPFTYNYYSKVARTSKGSILGKKILYKVQKNILQQHFSQQNYKIGQFKGSNKQESLNAQKRKMLTQDNPQVVLEKYLNQSKILILLKDIHCEQLQLKQLKNIYLKKMQQKTIKQKDPIHFRKSNFRMSLQVQKKQKQEFNCCRKKLKKLLLSKLNRIQEQDGKDTVANKLKINKNRGTKIMHQFLQYQIFQSLLFLNTDFTKRQIATKQQQFKQSQKLSSISFCQNQNYKQANQMMYESFVKVQAQQDRSCGNLICFEVNQIYKDQCVYHYT